MREIKEHWEPTLVDPSAIFPSLPLSLLLCIPSLLPRPYNPVCCLLGDKVLRLLHRPSRSPFFHQVSKAKQSTAALPEHTTTLSRRGCRSLGTQAALVQSWTGPPPGWASDPRLPSFPLIRVPARVAGSTNCPRCWFAGRACCPPCAPKKEGRPSSPKLRQEHKFGHASSSLKPRHPAIPPPSFTSTTFSPATRVSGAFVAAPFVGIHHQHILDL